MSEVPTISFSHDALVERAGIWLRKIGCKIVFTELATSTRTGEIPDAIGWKFSGQVSILVECKATRADFLADRNKRFRANPELGMGDWRFYLCPPGIITVEDLPAGWGLLYCTPRMIKQVHGVPDGINLRWGGTLPLKGNKADEITMLVSALRRLEIRGYLPLIYAGLPSGGTAPGAKPAPPVDVDRLAQLAAAGAEAT